MAIALPNVHIPRRLVCLAQTIEPIEHLLGMHRLRQDERVLGHGLPEGTKHFAPKHRHDDPHGQQEAVPHGDPLPRWAQPASCDETVHVGMQHQGLTPGVQRRDDARLRPEIRGVCQ